MTPNKRYNPPAYLSLDFADLSIQNIEHRNFRDSLLRCSNLYMAKASYACFRNADMSSSNLANGVFFGADFRGCNLSGCDLRGANFSKATMDRCDLSGCIYDKNTVFPEGVELCQLK